MSAFSTACIGIATESFYLLMRMAPYLVFGFFFAGVIHIFLSPERIARHLGARGFASVFKAALFGVPLPLCSCAVIPAALSLRREGASIGAVLAFLISTPTTGIDSIFATYALMGGLFTAYRVAASFAIGLLAGVLANLLLRDNGKKEAGGPGGACKLCDAAPAAHRHSLFRRATGVLQYAFVDLFDDVARWLVAGIVIGGAIAYLLPADFFGGLFGFGILAYLAMFAVGVPMYVCATASIPIAAGMMLKGLSPGAAFVFLVAGPATNAVTITVMMKELGPKAIAVYLGSIFAGSIVFGYTLDRVWLRTIGPFDRFPAMDHSPMLPPAVSVGAAFMLLSLVLYSLYRRSQKEKRP